MVKNTLIILATGYVTYISYDYIKILVNTIDGIFKLFS